MSVVILINQFKSTYQTTSVRDIRKDLSIKTVFLIKVLCAAIPITYVLHSFIFISNFKKKIFKLIVSYVMFVMST